MKENCYEEAVKWFALCYSLCDDEMGIAVIYWHTLCCYRASLEPEMISKYRDDMQVGHHTAYTLAVRVFAERIGYGTAIQSLGSDDLEFAIAMYGICGFLKYRSADAEYAAQMKILLSRDGFWPCYAYLAAWNDMRKPQ